MGNSGAKSGAGELRVPRHGGGKIRTGSKPGNTPGTGRPPDAFKAMCMGFASREATAKAVDRIMRDPDHPAFLGALKWATENGYGKPAQPVDVTSGGKRVQAFTLALGTIGDDDSDG